MIIKQEVTKVVSLFLNGYQTILYPYSLMVKKWPNADVMEKFHLLDSALGKRAIQRIIFHIFSLVYSLVSPHWGNSNQHP